jgi:hypothetical protein
MNHCPECGAGRFVSKLLVYEVTGYDEVAVLETERRAALRDQLRQLGRRFWRRLAARTTWLALGLVTLVTGLVIWL